MRPPFRYFGGKTRLAPWIASVLPAHRVYVEPFCGSAAVLLAKPRATHEVINDIDRNVVTFYRVLRDRPDDLARACALTPYARDEFDAANLADEALDDLERARRFYVRSTQGFSTGRRGGWSIAVTSRAARAMTTATRLGEFGPLAERLCGVNIEHADALDVIARYGTPDAVIYADPPYLDATREGQSLDAYPHEMATETAHRDLAAALNETPAAVVLSGYASPLYDDLYAGWSAHRSRRHLDRRKPRRSPTPGDRGPLVQPPRQRTTHALGGHPMTLPNPDEYGAIRSASDWLKVHAAGEIDRKLTDALTEVLAAVMDLGRSGTITLKLTVSQQDDASVLVLPTVTVKAPQPSSRAQHFYVDAERRLALADPYRPQLPFATHDLTGGNDR